MQGLWSLCACDVFSGWDPSSLYTHDPQLEISNYDLNGNSLNELIMGPKGTCSPYGRAKPNGHVGHSNILSLYPYYYVIL